MELMQSVYRDALRDDVVDALDRAERALRTVEGHSAADTGVTDASYAEAHQLIASAYERLCMARQIIEARD